MRNGTYGFHTDHETRPWWIVDLLEPYQVAAIHIYNRRDSPDMSARANELDVLGSADGVTWNTLWSNPNQVVYGLNGSPLVVTAPAYLGCRFVLLRLRGQGCLHLDEIEVYGTVITRSLPVHVPEGGPVIPTGSLSCRSADGPKARQNFLTPLRETHRGFDYFLNSLDTVTRSG